MGIFGKKKNKQFNLQTRYYKKDEKGSPFEIKGKFDAYRNTNEQTKIGIKDVLSIRKIIKMVWRKETSIEAEENVKKRLLIIIVILVLIVLYIIDFDLSIFILKSK